MPNPAARQTKRRPRFWVLFGACLVLLGVAGGGWYLHHVSAENRASAAAAAPLTNSRHPEPEPLPPPPPQGPNTLHAHAAGVRLDAEAVDPQVFHVVIAAPGGPTSAASPFVVETAALRTARQTGGTLVTPAGRLSLTPSGQVTLQDARGRSLLRQGIIRQGKNGLTLTFSQSRSRFYGSGNAGLGKSGGLAHTEGVSAVGNGVTRLPFVWTPDGFGVFVANNSTDIGWKAQGGQLRWTVPANYIDLYLIAAPTPYALLDAYTRLTGRPPVPPDWTFGYLQSRWGYLDAADVRDKWDKFRQLGIPVEAFIYDYDWFTGDWQFNPSTFPNPAADLAEMHRRGLHFVGIRKPRVHGANLEYAQKNGWTLTGADLRFDLPAVQDWWAAQHKPLVEMGVDGWWNDEAEHTYDQFFYMNVAERKGWTPNPQKPFWSLNRAFAPGMQRLGAAVWTGDIPTSWDSLQNQPGTMLNWSLCGMPYVGQDIGGFSGTPSPELYVRWMQAGALAPIMRAHGIQGSPRWPWAFGPQALTAARNAILLRSRLRPYLRECARETSRTGAPLMRPLFFEFPSDPNTYALEHEWLLGRDLLAAPVLAPGGRSAVYLPRGRWREYGTGRTLIGPRWLRRTLPLETVPLYLRGDAHSAAARRVFTSPVPSARLQSGPPYLPKAGRARQGCGQ